MTRIWKALRFISIIFFVVAELVGQPLTAGLATGTISPVVTQGNNAYFGMSSFGTRPGCVNVALGQWIFDITTASGQAMLANVLTASAAGRTADVVGTGLCAGNREIVDYVYVY